MLKKTITFQDFNGEMVAEDHFFHLSKADLIELEMSKRGGFGEWLKQTMDAEDGPEMIKEFKKLILMAYGKKSDDGRRFIRTRELRDDFLQSEAYSELFLELCTNPDAQIEFINGIVPTELSSEMKMTPTTPTPITKTTNPEPRVLTRQDLTELSHDEISQALAEGAVIAKN